MASRLKRTLAYYLAAKKPVSKKQLTNARELLQHVSQYSDAITANKDRNLSHLFGASEQDHLGNLDKHGISIMDLGLDSKMLEEIRSDLLEIENLTTNGDLKRDSVSNLEFRRGAQETSSMIRSNSAICVTREGDDAGMIDVFNLDRFSRAANSYKDKILESGVLSVIEEATGKRMRFSNMNAYINRDVTRTRGLHVDSYGVDQFKFFTYLTDVNELADGPYCYGVGSHKMQGLREINRFVNDVLGSDSTDIRIIPRENLVPILAKAGTSILSNQSAAHGGFPQAPGHFRMLAVMNFVSA